MEDKLVNAQLLINRFNTVISQAENIIFPDNRRGVFAARNMDDWSNPRKFFYKLSTPYLFTDEKPKIIYFIFSLFMLFMTIGTLILSQEVAWRPVVHLSAFETVIYTLFFLLAAWSFLEFLRDNRYSVIAKLSMTTVLLLLCLGQSISLLTNESNRIVQIDKLFKVSFLVGGAFTPILILLLNTIVSVIWAYILLLRNTMAIQSPLSKKAISKLLASNIYANEHIQENWKLLGLEKLELEYLRKWAESNRDASEKRTIPALVISAVIGFFVSTSAFHEMIANLFQSGPNRNSAEVFFAAVTLPFLMAFLIVFSQTLIALFKNIAIQSLIIETCIIAEYASESHNKKKTNSGSIFSFIMDVWNILFGLTKKQEK